MDGLFRLDNSSRSLTMRRVDALMRLFQDRYISITIKKYYERQERPRRPHLRDYWSQILKRPHNESNALSRSQQRRREDIIQASLKIFDRDGFDAARLIDIAEEAGVAKGTLYLYFDTKADLLEGVIETAIIPTLQGVEDVAQPHTGTAVELLTNQMRITARRMASPEMKTLLRYMISGGLKHQRIINFYFENVIQTGMAKFKKTLMYGVERGEFRKEAANIDPLILIGAQVYTTVWKILFEDLSPIDIDKLADDLIEMALRGLLIEQ